MISSTFQPNIEDPVHGDGTADIQQTDSPVNELAYGGSGSVKILAYGGNGSNYTTSGRLYRLERGSPFRRRGSMIPAIPRTKAETVYTRDPGQVLQNKVLNTGATGTGTSGVALSGTTNKPNATTGAVNRYLTPYKTLLQS